MIEVDLTLPHSYEVSEIGEFPGTGKFNLPVLYFPSPRSRPEHDGLWLRIDPRNGKSWIGVFAFGYQSPPAISRVLTTPNPAFVCVISKGRAYIVRTDEPGTWDQIPSYPVLDARLIMESSLIVFSSFTNLAAYGKRGLAWQSPRLCWDALKIVTVSDDVIEGVGYDPTNSATHEMRFAVDLKTGRSLLPLPFEHQ
jgi:hypothetical protein